MARPLLTREELRYSTELRTWRERRNLTVTAMADLAGYSRSRVSQIENGHQPPTEEFSRLADAALDAGGALWACWEAIAAKRFGVGPRAPERTLRTNDFVVWLADHSDHAFPDLYAAISTAAARFEAEPPSTRLQRDYARRLVTRDRITQRARAYYGPAGFCDARVAGVRLQLGVQTQAAWLDTAVPLDTPSERVRFDPTATTRRLHLDDVGVATAVERLAYVEVNGTVLVNNPLYRLVDLDLRAGHLDATLTTVPFAEHALTTELMEGEMLAAIAAGTEHLQLRDRLLPDTSTVFDLAGRACVGGAATLLAIARRQPDGTKDYVLFAQERSRTVMNLAGKLAVIPKCFHQPTSSVSDEVPISSTLRREFEEELLGREDLEQVAQHRHGQVDLLHPQSLTPPAAWLAEHPDAWRIECTGLAFNTLTSNYDFSCLIVIEDDAWWERFGHLVVKNWEADRIYRHSSLDTAGLVALVQDPRWGNESLFAFLQGLRRLAEVGGPGRVAVPPVELDVA